MTTYVREASLRGRVEALAEEHPDLYKLARMGGDQWSFLSSMCEHNGWSELGSGWTWDNRSTTIKLAESLVKRGLLVDSPVVDKYNRTRHRYLPAPAIAVIYTDMIKAQQAADSAHWAERKAKENLAFRRHQAHEYALSKLVQAYEDQYKAWIAEFEANNPVKP